LTFVTPLSREARPSYRERPLGAGSLQRVIGPANPYREGLPSLSLGAMSVRV